MVENSVVDMRDVRRQSKGDIDMTGNDNMLYDNQMRYFGVRMDSLEGE